MNLKREMVIPLVATVFILSATIADLPPFSSSLEPNETLKASWVVDERDKAPLGHAELRSLDSFTDKLKIDKEKALVELSAKGIVVQVSNDFLEKIAKENKISPLGICKVIRKFELRKEEVVVEALTAAKVEEILEGKGVGRRDIIWLVVEYKLDPDSIGQKLQKSNIKRMKVVMVKGYTL